MDLSSFLKVLFRHKYTLIIVPLVTVVITYFLVRNQPDTYISDAEIATGIVDQTQQSLNTAAALLQDSKITQEFSNLMAQMRSKKMLGLLGYQLIIHDLTSPTPYRKPSKIFNQLNANAKAHAVAVYKEMYAKRQTLSLFNNDQKGLHDLLASMRYDDESLTQKLTIYRYESSDFIFVQFESENPDLSAQMVNTLCREFIKYYTELVKTGQQKAVDFYSDLLNAKQDTLNKRLESLKNYKIRNRVLNLSEQAKSLYGQLSDFETRREQSKKDAIAYKSAIDNIDRQFNPTDRRYAESSMVRINQDVISTRTQLESVNDAYIQSGFKPAYAKRVDSLKNILAAQINTASDKYIVSPLVSKQSLIQQKLTMQIQYDLSKSAAGSIQRELVRLNSRLTQLVPHEAMVQAYETAIQIAHDEYMDILNKYNQTRLQSNFPVQLRQIETAMPGGPKPSKKMLLVIIGGVVSFIFCLVVLFILFYLDNSIKTARELANATKISVLGYLGKLSGSSFDLGHIWNNEHSDKEHLRFKHLMQSIRFETDTELNGKKILLINSLNSNEGKTFVALNLAYAYALINKKVLLIDGNFSHAAITQAVNTKTYLEDYLSGKIADHDLASQAKIATLGNKGGDISLLQLATPALIDSKLQQLQTLFDVIIIEAPALSALNKSKEWIAFADKIVTVLKAGQTLKTNKKQQIAYLKGLSHQFGGWVLNEVSKNHIPADQ